MREILNLLYLGFFFKVLLKMYLLTGKSSVVEAERSLTLLKQLSSSPECIGHIIKALQVNATNICDFFERFTDTHIHVCFSSLLHHILRVSTV